MQTHLSLKIDIEPSKYIGGLSLTAVNAQIDFSLLTYGFKEVFHILFMKVKALGSTSSLHVTGSKRVGVVVKNARVVCYKYRSKYLMTKNVLWRGQDVNRKWDISPQHQVGWNSASPFLWSKHTFCIWFNHLSNRILFIQRKKLWIELFRSY